MKRNYLSYLLRIWQAGSPESPNWVASLEDPHSHEVLHFKSLDALLQHLLLFTQNPAADLSPADLKDEQTDS